MSKQVSWDPEMLKKAIDTILSGAGKRVDLGGGVKVYEVQNVVRIDLKAWDDE